MEKLKLLILSWLLFAFCLTTLAQDSITHYYQFKIYHLKNKDQENLVEQFLQAAYLPALHRAGVEEVGVFKPRQPDTTDYKIYVFIPYKSLGQLESVEEVLMKDKEYLQKGKQYLDAPYNSAPYNRIESILLQAFSGMPAPAAPALTGKKSDRVYELRSYESATEKYYINKVEMFNEGDEIGIFKNLNFNAIFYGKVLSGTRMPNLMYMTSFNDKEERDKRWQAFRDDPAWKALSSKPQYQKNVSKADILFLYPTEYSDF